MCSWNRKSCHLNTAQTVECQPAGEYVSSIRISCLVNFFQVPNSSQFDMHLLHWSNGNALFPGQDSETQLKRWNLQHQRESESVNKQETACEPDTPPYWFQSWIIYAPSGSITLYHSSSLLCFFPSNRGSSCTSDPIPPEVCQGLCLTRPSTFQNRWLNT